MVVFADLSWATDSSCPDKNFIPQDNERQPKWVVCDDSEVAAKIKMAERLWIAVEDENGLLIDIIEASPQQNELNMRRAEEIKRQLAELDDRTVRSMRAVMADTATDDDRDKLREIEEQAKTLRDELAELETIRAK